MSSLLDVFDVAGSSMDAQSKRLNVVASNLANADSVTSSNGQPYKAKQVIFSAAPVGNGATGVRVQQVVEDPNPPKLVYKPNHPLADANGYVATPNVNMVDEMVNMISASRSYQTNVDVVKAAETMVSKTLTMGQ
jgi:flagellar basal-body rod protein FlgC